MIPTVVAADVPADAIVLDVREDYEWFAGHIEGARHIPMMELPQHAQDGDGVRPDEPLVVVCKVGSRSAQVTAWLLNNGFDAVNLDGGLVAWERAGRALVSEDGSPPRVV
jgi:rhodanese-related sulfurtransferase